MIFSSFIEIFSVCSFFPVIEIFFIEVKFHWKFVCFYLKYFFCLKFFFVHFKMPVKIIRNCWQIEFGHGKNKNLAFFQMYSFSAQKRLFSLFLKENFFLFRKENFPLFWKENFFLFWKENFLLFLERKFISFFEKRIFSLFWKKEFFLYVLIWNFRTKVPPKCLKKIISQFDLKSAWFDNSKEKFC